MTISQWYIDGGQYMNMIVLVFFVALSVIIAAMLSFKFSGKGVFLKVTFAFILFPVAVGAFGYYISSIHTFTAASMVDPAMEMEIYDMGMAVARRPLFLGSAGSLFLLILWVTGYKKYKKLNSKS